MLYTGELFGIFTNYQANKTLDLNNQTIKLYGVVNPKAQYHDVK